MLIEEGAVVCGVYDLRGTINLPPRRWLRLVRRTMAEFEKRAQAAGVTEMRVAGRDWSSVLGPVGYEAMPELPNGLRKRL